MYVHYQCLQLYIFFFLIVCVVKSLVYPYFLFFFVMIRTIFHQNADILSMFLECSRTLLELNISGKAFYNDLQHCFYSSFSCFYYHHDY